MESGGLIFFLLIAAFFFEKRFVGSKLFAIFAANFIVNGVETLKLLT
jgi:hypothetical protein